MSLALTAAIIVIILIRIIHTATHEGFVSAGLIVAIIFVALYFLASILQV